MPDSSTRTLFFALVRMLKESPAGAAPRANRSCLYLVRSIGSRMVKTASSLKKSRGISSSRGLPGVGTTMPKSWALPSNFGWTVKLSTFSLSSQVMNAFCDGWLTSLSLAAK